MTAPADDHVFALFRPDGDTFVPLPTSLSKWSGDMVGGFAVCGLLAHAFEPHCPDGFVPARLGVEMFRPVPASALRVDVEVVREGNRIAVCDAVVLAGDLEVTRATVTFLKQTEEPPGRVWARPDVPQPPPEDLCPVQEGPIIPFFGSDDRWDTSMKVLQDAGRKKMWQGGMPIVPDVMPTPFECAALISDAGNMVSHWGENGVGFINCDVQLSLARLPRRDGLGIIADGQTSFAGVSSGNATLFDRTGVFGHVMVSALANARRQVDFSGTGSYTQDGRQVHD